VLTTRFADGPYPAYAWSFSVAGGGSDIGYGMFDRRGSGPRAQYLDAVRRLLPRE
jgi:menaquinone-9 beta-reductase